MRSTIGRRRLLLMLAGTSIGLVACSSSQPPAPAKPAEPASAPAKPTEAASAPATAKPAAAASPTAAASPAASTAASPVAAASPAASPAAAPKPAAGTTPGGTFVIASLGPLPKTAHPYPNSADYSDGWTQIAGLMFGGGLLDQDANTLEYQP